MMPANAHMGKKFARLCFEKSEVTSADKMVSMLSDTSAMSFS